MKVFIDKKKSGHVKQNTLLRQFSSSSLYSICELHCNFNSKWWFCLIMIIHYQLVLISKDTRQFLRQQLVAMIPPPLPSLSLTKHDYLFINQDYVRTWWTSFCPWKVLFNTAYYIQYSIIINYWLTFFILIVY